MSKDGLLSSTASPTIIPANQMPQQGLRVRLTAENGIATLEFERDTRWMQFNKTQLIEFIQSLANLANRL